MSVRGGGEGGYYCITQLIKRQDIVGPLMCVEILPPHSPCDVGSLTRAGYCCSGLPGRDVSWNKGWGFYLLPFSWHGQRFSQIVVGSPCIVHHLIASVFHAENILLVLHTGASIHPYPTWEPH